MLTYKRTKCTGRYHVKGYKVIRLEVVGKTVMALMGRKGGEEGVVGDSDSDDDEEQEEIYDESSSESDSESSSFSSSPPKTPLPQSSIVLFHYANPSNPLTYTSTLPLPNNTTNVCHPNGYLNKVVVSTQTDGKAGLELWNLSKSKLIHTFKNLPHDLTYITAISNTPAVDTVALGNSGGEVVLFNLKYDKVLFALKHARLDRGDGGRTTVTDVTFRTDPLLSGTASSPMAVGRTDGYVTVWNLHTKTKVQSFHAHEGGVVSAKFTPGEPLLITSGADNSVKVWVFDGHDGSCRLLRSRAGHRQAPHNIRYLQETDGVRRMNDGTDARACEILTGGTDRQVRVFSTARAQVDVEWSQGKGLEKKAREMKIDKTELLLPPVLAFATATGNGKGWGDVVTIHEGSSFGYVWSSERKGQTGATLRQEEWNVGAMQKKPPMKSNATSVSISACGNFAVVGSRGGVIYKYNLQSGMERGTYPKNVEEVGVRDGERRAMMPSKLPGSVKRTMKVLTPGEVGTSNLDRKQEEKRRREEEEERRTERQREARHYDPVVGIAVDAVNRALISVDETGKLCVWDFKTKSPHKKSPVYLPVGITGMAYIRDSDLCAFSTVDFGVLVYDSVGMNVVRRMGGKGKGHTGPVTGMAFGGGGRRIFTSVRIGY